VSLKKLLAAPQPLEALAQELGLGSKVDDLLTALGYGKVSIRQVLQRILPPEKVAAPVEAKRPIADAVRRLLRVGEDRIKVKGTDDLLVYRARCCNPIQGEPIIGYITRGKGVSVHSESCPNVVKGVYDPERRVAVEWERGATTAYEVGVSVRVADRPGLLAAITRAVADQKADIRNAEAHAFDDKTASIELTLRVNDLRHFERAVKSIRAVTGVIDVERQAVAR
jgi:GTP diphosphokinase / guanosine-3',5'-bis(diphosphate) 3'-diphosphatase